MKLNLNRDYLRELIAEARRNETLGWALVVVGALALIIMIDFQQLVNDSGPFTNYVFMLTIVLMGIGVILAGYYGSRKKKYMEKLRES